MYHYISSKSFKMQNVAVILNLLAYIHKCFFPRFYIRHTASIPFLIAHLFTDLPRRLLVFPFHPRCRCRPRRRRRSRVAARGAPSAVALLPPIHRRKRAHSAPTGTHRPKPHRSTTALIATLLTTIRLPALSDSVQRIPLPLHPSAFEGVTPRKTKTLPMLIVMQIITSMPIPMG